MLITPLFAAMFGFIYIALAANVVRYRFGKNIPLGDQGDTTIERAIRAHANFIEYVPMSLLIFYFLEILSLSGQLVFFLASTLLIARVCHIVGMLNPKEWLVLRKFGAAATFTVMIIASCALTMHYVPVSI